MSFDDIVADTDDGLLFETNRSWSIDDRRLNFQFATEVCREIKGGKPGKLYRNGTYTGITYELWRSMDAVGDASSWRMWGTPNCGKGEPGQTGHVGHGVSGGAVPQRAGRGGRMSSEHGIGGDPEEALRLAEQVIQRPRRPARARPRRWSWPASRALTRFANSEIHQNVASAEVFVNLRFVKGRRVGVATSGRIDAEGIRALVERAATIAANVEELEDWAGLPTADRRRRSPPAGPSAPPHASPELRAEGARAVIAAADEAGVTAFGSFSTDAEAIAVANTKGIRAAERRTTSQLLTVTMGPDNGTGYAEQCAVDATHDRRRRDRPRGRRARPGEREPRRPRARRLPGRAPPLRGRRPARHARLPRLLGPRRPGGPLVLGGGQAGRLAARVDRRRRARPGRAPDGLRRRGRPQAAPRAARRRRLPRPRVRRPDRGPRRPPRPPATASRPRTRTARSRPTW